MLIIRSGGVKDLPFVSFSETFNNHFGARHAVQRVHKYGNLLWSAVVCPSMQMPSDIPQLVSMASPGTSAEKMSVTDQRIDQASIPVTDVSVGRDDPEKSAVVLHDVPVETGE